MGIDMRNHNLNAMPDAEKNRTPVPLFSRSTNPNRNAVVVRIHAPLYALSSLYPSSQLVHQALPHLDIHHPCSTIRRHNST